MLTDDSRMIVEEALGRPLNAEEEAGYPSLAALPAHVIEAVKTILSSTNRVAVSVYLRHVVPSASVIQVKDFMDDMSL